MAKLIVVLGDQLSPALASLRDVQPDDRVLMAEVASEATYTPHHTHKIILIFSAMRHFAATLQQQGVVVSYLDYQQKISSLTEAVAIELARHPQLDQICITECGEYRLEQEILSWQQLFQRPLQMLEDDRFIASKAMFQHWAQGRQQYRMEYFYREMRRYTGLLMQNGQPVGGQWNFDANNRKSMSSKQQLPDILTFEPDEITAEVVALVKLQFPNNMGDAEQFSYAVTGKQARAAFLHFVEYQLPLFGDYQDAMQLNEPHLFHSICSMYLNCGLLDVRWVCQKVETAYKEGKVPLNAAEGFIRQIIGWREFVRGLYWLLMPEYKERNFLKATTALPAYYWTAKTKMRCMQQAVSHTIKHAYSHHIQRLMVTGNFALLAGLSVDEVCNWYLAVYADAYEWVELPNTLGMALFADHGVLASKPYAASGKYIQRMSNYCKSCAYDVGETTSPTACPFNALYWNFLDRNKELLSGNARMQLSYQNWYRKSDEERTKITEKAQQLLIHLEQL
jgi:deoxyribodipyrimidine photolyase-related protein